MAQLDTLKKKNKTKKTKYQKKQKQDQEKKEGCLEFVILTQKPCFHLYPSATPQNIPIFIISLSLDIPMCLNCMWAFWAFDFSTQKYIKANYKNLLTFPTFTISLHIYLFFLPYSYQRPSLFSQYLSLIIY